MGFGHFWEIVIIFLLALVVFGPKRMIEMVTRLGKSLLETRDALRQINWSLTSAGEDTPADVDAGATSAPERAHVVESAPPDTTEDA